MITTTAKIKLRKKISDNLFLLSINLEKYKEWIPGMFMQISLDVRSGSNYWLDSKAFSFASWGSQEARILVRREGSFTTQLISQSEKGFVASIRYPFGDFLLNSDSDKVFIAGGAGISVFLSYLDFITLRGSDNKVTLLFYSAKRIEGSLMRFPAKIGLVIIFLSSRKLTISFLPNEASSLTVSGNANQDGFAFLSATGRSKTYSNSFRRSYMYLKLCLLFSTNKPIFLSCATPIAA